MSPRVEVLYSTCTQDSFCNSHFAIMASRRNCIVQRKRMFKRRNAIYWPSELIRKPSLSRRVGDSSFAASLHDSDSTTVPTREIEFQRTTKQTRPRTDSGDNSVNTGTPDNSDESQRSPEERDNKQQHDSLQPLSELAGLMSMELSRVLQNGRAFNSEARTDLYQRQSSRTL